MTIEDSEDFTLLLNSSAKLSQIAIFRVFLGLAVGLNRGCKCNKEKRRKSLDLSYRTVLLKKKDSEAFRNGIKDVLADNNEQLITFYSNKEKLFSLDQHEL